LPDEGINETGFADVGTAEERDFREGRVERDVGSRERPEEPG